MHVEECHEPGCNNAAAVCWTHQMHAQDREDARTARLIQAQRAIAVARMAQRIQRKRKYLLTEEELQACCHEAMRFTRAAEAALAQDKSDD